MVEKFKTILAEFKTQNIQVSLFAVLKMDEFADRWSVIFAAPDLEDDAKQQAMFEKVVNTMLGLLDEKERQEIARVGVFPLNNHLVENLKEYKEGFEFKEKTPVNGNVIHAGYILENVDNR